MKVAFTYRVIPSTDGFFRCHVEGLGNSISFKARKEERALLFKQAESHIVIRKLRTLFMQRHLMFCIMGYGNHHKMKVLEELQQGMNSISLIPPNRIYSFIVDHKLRLLSICPNKRTQFNFDIEKLIVHAIMEI